MMKASIALLPLTICLSFAAAADQNYRTKKKNERLDPALVESFSLDRSHILVDPQSGEKLIYLTPETQTQAPLTVSAQVSPNQAVSAAADSLTRLMNRECRQGWSKVREWSSPAPSGYYLHYDFTCLLRKQ